MWEYMHAARPISPAESYVKNVKPIKLKNGISKALVAGAPDCFPVSKYYAV